MIAGNRQSSHKSEALGASGSETPSSVLGSGHTFQVRGHCLSLCRHLQYPASSLPLPTFSSELAVMSPGKKRLFFSPDTVPSPAPSSAVPSGAEMMGQEPTDEAAGSAWQSPSRPRLEALQNLDSNRDFTREEG